MKKPLTFIFRQKIKFTLWHFPLRYYKDIVNLLFWVLWECLAKHTQSDTINLQKTFVFFCRQKINFTRIFFWRYCKDIQNSYFGYFGHAWLHTPKMIASACRRLLCLSACQKTFIIHFFLEILHIKNELSWKNRFCQFLDITIIYHRAENQENLLSHFWKKTRRTDGRTDRKTTEILYDPP